MVQSWAKAVGGVQARTRSVAPIKWANLVKID